VKIAWGALFQRSYRRLKTGWLIAAGMIAIYLGAVQPMDSSRGVAQEKATGMGVAEWQPASMWQSGIPRDVVFQKVTGVIGGVPGGVHIQNGQLRNASLSVSLSQGSDEDRKISRTGSMDLVVKSPKDISEKIRLLAEHIGGFLVSSETYGGQDASSASLTIRVPANRFEEARLQIRKLGLHVDGEKLDAQDVTRQYVDQAARLRNLRAQETQYLGILKQAKTVKDTLEVSDKLNEVRGQIEQQQAEFDALSKQVETVALTISLRAETDAQVFGLHWRPLYQLKLAARQGLDSIADYGVAMASFLFYLPAVLLWLVTILIGAALGWRILRWARLALFVPRRKTAPA
jgi:hypothetical protein